MIYRKGIDNIDWGSGWGHTMGEEDGRWQKIHSCVGDSGSAWGLLEAAGLPSMRV